MTRIEEIENAAKQKYPYEGGIKGMICENSIPIFIQGAEWADKTMIDKACKWMEENLREVHPRTGEEVCIVNLNSFREAMEE